MRWILAVACLKGNKRAEYHSRSYQSTIRKSIVGNIHHLEIFLQLFTMEKDLEEMLKKMPGLFKEREEDLKKREKALGRLRASIEEEYPNIGKPDDVLSLNVGGTRLYVLRRTLTQVQGSMLASRFSGRWDDSLEKTAAGEFYIDQPIELFLPMLNYLRALACSTPLVPRPPSPKIDPKTPKIDPKNQRDFDRMVEYYGMSLGIYPVGIYRLEGGSKMSLVAVHPDYEVDSDDQFVSYCLQPLEYLHNKYIKSFEVKVNGTTLAQVGWAHESYIYNVLSKGQDGTQGVGYSPYDVSYDVGRSGMAIQGNFQSIPKSSMKEGSVIRCENQGESWYIDGELIASTLVHDNVAQLAMSAFGGIKFRPCISIKGNFEVTSIEFQL